MRPITHRSEGRSMRRFALFCLVALLPMTGNSPALAEAGSLDRSFGSMGRVTTSFPAGGAWGNALAIQADGKIVVAGSVDGAFALARYDPDGSLDTSFGSSGLVTTSFAEGDAWGNALAIQANGLIVVGGSAGGKFALVRYTIDGLLDSSFGSGGQLTTWFAGGRAWATAVTIQTDGKIVAAGGDGRKFALARYETNGALDNRFGGDGKVRTDFGPQAKDYVIGATLQSDGKIVAAGKVRIPVVRSRQIPHRRLARSILRGSGKDTDALRPRPPRFRRRRGRPGRSEDRGGWMGRQ